MNLCAFVIGMAFAWKLLSNVKSMEVICSSEREKKTRLNFEVRPGTDNLSARLKTILQGILANFV